MSVNLWLKEQHTHMVTQLTEHLGAVTEVMAGNNHKSDGDAVVVMCQWFPKPPDYNVRI